MDQSDRIFPALDHQKNHSASPAGLLSEDLLQIREQGLSLAQIQEQLDIFKKGKSWIPLIRPCLAGDGVQNISSEKADALVALHERGAKAGRMMEFIPASGAGTRMFQPLLQFLLDQDLTPEVERFLQELPKFPFFSALQKSGEDAKGLIEHLLTEKGLHYAGLPKGMIPFHQYSSEIRTPLEEHLIEAKLFIQDQTHDCRLHFVVSPAFFSKIQTYFQDIADSVSFSVQSPSTDTVSVDLSFHPLRDKGGKLIFRPGGHGALLENLNQLKGDIVFIHNVDNVPHESHFPKRVFYRKLLSGYLIELQTEIFAALAKIKQGANEAKLDEISEWIQQTMGITSVAGWKTFTSADKRAYLFHRLNRPLRVCGVIKKEGDVGGAPFWVRDAEGGESLQFIEESQVDENSFEQKKIFHAAAYFNPVNIVCGVKDYLGNPFNLKKFTDPRLTILTKKYQNGNWVQALEWPGLWNGGMAGWNTVFVEVPPLTFTPVKTFLDLLRPEHQAAS